MDNLFQRPTLARMYLLLASLGHRNSWEPCLWVLLMAWCKCLSPNEPHFGLFIGWCPTAHWCHSWSSFSCLGWRLKIHEDSPHPAIFSRTPLVPKWGTFMTSLYLKFWSGFLKMLSPWVKPKIRILGGLYSANFHGGLDRLTSKARKTNPEAWFDKWDWKKKQRCLQIALEKGPIRFHSQEIFGSHITQPSSGMPWRSTVGIHPCLASLNTDSIHKMKLCTPNLLY